MSDAVVRWGSEQEFIFYLFLDHLVAIEFLKDMGLLRRTMQCKSCHRDMTWTECTDINDGFVWQWRRRSAGTQCKMSTSIRHGSWFQHSKLTLQEIMLFTYDILCHEPANQIEREYCFSDHTVADWGMFCREAMLVFLEGCKFKIGVPNRTVEIDESKFGKRKYNIGHHVEGQ
jgi:hypothetical protein